MKILILQLCAKTCAAVFSLSAFCVAAEYAKETDIAYYDEAALKTADDYQKEKCKLDVYHPTGQPGFATVIWYHGGGLTDGSRDFPELKEKGIALISVGYRLAPPGKFPCFLEDAAASTAWVFRNIEKYGGDPKKVFISGISAGGYLAAMVGMDPQWLAKYDISNRSLAGIIPVSAQVTTHFHVKELLGDTGPSLKPVINEYAPLFYASKDLPPVCLLVGDRKVEFKSRVEENELLAVTLKNLGHPLSEFHEMPGLDHGHAAGGAAPLMPAFIKKVLATAKP